MVKKYRRIFGDPIVYEKFALTEDEIIRLKKDLGKISETANESDKQRFIELTTFIDAQLKDIDRNGAALPDGKEFAAVFKKIEGLEPTVTFEAYPSNATHHGQKFVGELIGLWSVPRSSGVLLDRLVAFVRPKRIIEIGTSAGYSTLWMANGLVQSKSGNKIDTVDNFPPKLVLAKQHFKEAGVDGLIAVHGTDALAYLKSQPADSAEFIFLDADKERYAEYLSEAERILTRGGVLVADNVYDFGKSMAPFLSELKKSRRFLSCLIEIDNGLLLAQKSSMN